MSKILVDELVNLVGTDKVTFSEGLKISNGETIDLNGATITLDTGIGLNDQLLASTGSGLKWVTFSDTNSTYAFASVNAAVNDVKLNLTGGGDAAGQLNQVTMTGSGSVSLTENAGVITVTGTDTNTTYDLLFADETDGASATLTGSDSSADALILKGGSNIDVTRSNNIITFSTTLSGTVGAPSTTTDNAVALFDGTNGTLLKNSTLVYDSSGNLSGVNSLDTATQTASKIPFWYDQISSFPSATQYEGSFAFSNANNTMHFAAGNSWYQVARIDDLTLDTDTTYSIALTGTSTASLVLSDSNAVTDTVTFRRNTYGTIELERDGDNLYFDDRVYSVSAVTGPGSGAYLRLTGQNHDKDGNVTTTVTDDITLLGANGLVISRTDANTITFTQGGGSGGGGSYTDGDAKDAAATALLNGTSLGITFTYDSVNKVINTQVGTTPTTFNFTTASETDNYLVTGSDRGNTYNGDADPTITVYEGDTITFDNTATRVSHPMYIRVASEGASVSNPAATGEGTATTSWTPTTAGTYYYQCGSHPNMIGTITVLSAGGGGGGSAILYDLYGTNTTSNNVILNLDPSVGNTDQIEFTGADATTLSWDASNNRVTISSPAQVQPDWDATSGLGQILNKPTIPTAYTLPAATTTTLGGMIAGTGINIQPSGEIETSLQIITDANNSTTNDLSAAGLTLNTNYTSVTGNTGDIKRIGDLPYYYDGTDWRLFYLTGQPTSAAQTDVNFDDVQVRLTGTTNNHSQGYIYNHINGGYFASAGTAGSVTSPVKYGSYALEFEGTNSSYIRTTNSHPAYPLPIVQASDNTYSTTAKRSGFPDFSGSWTFEAWVRFDDLSGATADRWGIMCRTKINGTGAGLGVGLSLIKNSGSMQWLLGWYNGTGLTTDIAVPFQAFHDYGAFDWQEDTWYHISVSRRASDGRLFCHLNGNFVAPSAATNGEYFDTDLNQVVTTPGEYEFRLGNNRSNMASFASAQNQREHYLLGAIDDVRWTDYQRYDNTNFTPPTEAYPITAPVPPTVDPDWDDVVLRFPFDTSLNDVSSNELTGTASNAVYVYRASTPLKYGTNVLRFDGINHYLEVSDPNYVLRFGGTWTAEFWFNADSLPTVTGYRNCIWSTTSSSQNTQDVGFGIEAYNYSMNHYRFYWRNTLDATEMHYDDFAGEDFIGKWNHIAITRDSQGDFKVYFNGYRLRYNVSDNDFFNDSNISALTGADNQFRFGLPSDDVNAQEYGIDGYIDDFRLTSTVKYTENFTPPSGPLPTTGTVTPDPGTPTSSVTGLSTRDELTGSVTLDADATGDLNITGYKAYSLLKIETDADAWVRVYTDAAARTADATRSEFADPSPGDGVIAETRGSGEIQLSPPPYGYNNDSPNVGDTIYTAVTNRSGSNATINVTLTAIRLEA